MQVNRRLYRCRHDKRVAGVASGLAEYFGLDTSLVRVTWVLSILFGGVGLLLYIAMVIIVPLEPEEAFVAAGAETGEATGEAPAASPTGWHSTHSTPVPHHNSTRGDGRGATIVGVILILFGTLALVNAFLPEWADGGRFLWPAFIVGIGALLVATAVRRQPTEP
jgi:phage shock protein C